MTDTGQSEEMHRTGALRTDGVDPQHQEQTNKQINKYDFY